MQPKGFNAAAAVERVPQLKRGVVWCRTCGREQRVDSEQIEHLERTRDLAEQTAAERLRVIEEQAAEIDRLRQRVKWFEGVAGNTPLVVEFGQLQTENYKLRRRVDELEKDYDYAVETIQEIVNRGRPLLPVALEAERDRLRADMRYLHSCTLPDPHDEREVDAEWLKNKAREVTSAALQEGE